VRIERVMTDNAKNYTDSRAFAGALDELGARHLTIPPYRPQVNGKSERFNRTMLDEWAYARMYASNEERRRALGPWLEEYDHRRPHTALGGRTPMRRWTRMASTVTRGRPRGERWGRLERSSRPGLPNSQ
jgi:transposase InsO family protein